MEQTILIASVIESWRVIDEKYDWITLTLACLVTTGNIYDFAMSHTMSNAIIASLSVIAQAMITYLAYKSRKTTTK